MNPFFSIVIPTKARPHFVDIALYSLHQQSFDDFEVIISDDYDWVSCRDVVRRYNDTRFRHIVPPKELHLGMCGNWEYGLEHASGQYVIFIQDKMYLYRDSLQYLHKFIVEHSYPSIVSWNWDYYALDDETASFKGRLLKTAWSGKYMLHDIGTLVKTKMRFEAGTYQNPFGAPGPASPLCGAIQLDLYTAAGKNHKAVFDFINPDYGPPIALLEYAYTVYELENHLAVLIPSGTSEGVRHSRNYTAAVEFLEKSPCGVSRLQYATVPNLYITNSNMVSADYNYSILHSQRFHGFPLCNVHNVMTSIMTELIDVKFPDEITKMHEFEKIGKVLFGTNEMLVQSVLAYAESKQTKDKSLAIPRWKQIWRAAIPVSVRLKIAHMIHGNPERFYASPKESI